MRLCRRTGEPIRDIRTGWPRSACPVAPTPAEPGGCQAVLEFQRSRGNADGSSAPTPGACAEASYRLGDRLLFLRRHMLRGDDVAELQSRLNGLGFDAGKVDGIFGPDTQRAVLEFQRNRHLAEDGMVGPEVITELRLVTRATLRAGRETIRELEWLRARPPTIVGVRVFIDAACRTESEAATSWIAANAAAIALQERGGVPLLSRSHDVTMPERLRARRANRLGADLIVSFGVADERLAVYYYSSNLGRSEVGALLAQAVASRLGTDYEGRATPMLKETRAPAIVVEAPDLDEKTAVAGRRDRRLLPPGRRSR